MPRDAVSRTANVGTVGTNGLMTGHFGIRGFGSRCCVARQPASNLMTQHQTEKTLFSLQSCVPLETSPDITEHYPIEVFKGGLSIAPP